MGMRIKVGALRNGMRLEVCGRGSAVFACSRAMARSSSGKRGSLYADLERLRMHFSSLDPDNTGYIGYQELTALAQSESGMDESMVPELLERLDRDKDGKVSTRLHVHNGYQHWACMAHPHPL